MSRKLSQRGLEFIAGHESFVDHVYLDPVGVETVGLGTTRRDAIEKYRGGITYEQALAELHYDVERFEAAIRRNILVPLNQNQWDALVSFVYNVGEGGVTPSESTLARYLNEGNYEAAAAQLLRWNKAGDPPKELGGLTRRRNEERAMFLEPPIPEPAKTPIEPPEGSLSVVNLISPNERHELVMQEDGNLVLYTDHHPVWATGTHGNQGAYCLHQPDGNLVIYSADKLPIWDSGTWNYPLSWLIVQDDGNVVIYSKTMPGSTAKGKATVLYQPVWDSGTWERTFVPLPELPPTPEQKPESGAHPDPVGQIDTWGFEDGVAGFQVAFAPWDLAVDDHAGPLTALAVQWVVDNGERLSSYFVIDEMRSKGNGRVKAHRETLRIADRIREKKGPWTPISAYRDPAHNVRVGGAVESRHLYGEALDVPYDLGLTIDEAKECGAEGIGDCDGIVLHIDRGPTRTWGYC